MNAGSVRRHALRSGVLSGIATGIGFAAFHQLLISDIWFSLVPMMVAGAVCGLCLAWSYPHLVENATPFSWLLYNLAFVGLFVLLGAVSFLLYDPVYTIQGLTLGLESPEPLLREAIPVSAAFGLVAGVALSVVRGRTVASAASIIVTCICMAVLVGHNAAVLGMLHLSQEAVPLIVEFYGLFVAIMVGHAGVFFVLERRRLFAQPPPHSTSRWNLNTG